VSWRRLLAAGFVAAALVAIAGGAFELWHFGRSDEAAAGRVEAHVRRDFDGMTAALSTVAARVTRDPAAARSLSPGSDEARTLFDLVAQARDASVMPEAIAVTVYDVQSVARAWVGRPSDIPAAAERISGPSSFFIAQSAVGLRLVHVEPVLSAEGGRLGAVAAEHVLSPGGPATTLTATDYTLQTPLAPVSLRMRWEGAGDESRPGAFILRAPSGEPLAEAAVGFDDLRRARTDLRRHMAAGVLITLGLTILFLIGPVLDARARADDDRAFGRATLAAAGLAAAGALTIWAGLAWAARGLPRIEVNLLVGASAAAALAALAAGAVGRVRVRFRGHRRAPSDAPAQFIASQLVTGTAAAAVIILLARLLAVAVDPVSIDLRHFSLHPWDGSRILLLGGVLAAQAAALWSAILILALGPAAWRLPRRAGAGRLVLVALWLVPAAAGAAVASWADWPVSMIGIVASAAACAVTALAGHRLVAWYRHATVAARIFALFLAFLLPVLLIYPSMDFLARRATERLITTEFAVEAQRHPETLLTRLAEARAEIDALPSLPDLVTGTSAQFGAPRTDSAFLVWSQTVLARARLTSSIELFDRSGMLISRFALNLPEYTGTPQKPEPAFPCMWDVFGEAAPVGSEERSVLHAQRNICVEHGGENGVEVMGSIVVHVAFDYRALPFISSQSPYFEVFRPEDGALHDGTPAHDVDVVIYGWGLRPMYTSGRSAWPISDELFARIYASRDPFWATVPRGNDWWRVYFSNDRAAIFAIGYPILTLFDRFVHVAELTTLAGATFVLVLIGTALFTRASRERPRVGRALLREIRASFYRKLFLAFVLASIIPVITLALVIRAYFAELLRTDVQAAAARTAAVAKRVIEGSDSLLSRSDGVAGVSDDVMIWISQVIDQDVNIFVGARLVATSERDLFASGLLPTRTPDDVYRAIALQRLPSFVDEDRIGTFSYMIAAAPVRAAGGDAILTVPLTLRRLEIERAIAELDRGVHLAALFFILLGAAIGLSLAERIADPVRRLTRATRLIARGDFDARIAVRSADELKRLVDAFNSMAGELKAQREQLERTHRIEAWAEMARQVAHEIKNPLTPIQLSAEHLRRVHADSGEPMGPVLEGCVSAILGQVRLLRQIAGEFSSFASSPTARRAPVDVVQLVAEVIDPYRTGLQDRIDIANRATGAVPPAMVDRRLIARALANIVENALHAMPAKGELTIDADSDSDWVTLTIRDTGGGMDEDALARVFEPYFSTKATGTGLGLPIARRNVEISGGTIEVESRKGHGTTVVVKLPVAGSAAL
jgi:signal transduction histidine kinase